ncbi:MAG: diguanylate cyclase [Alphaproteobacteria bacterium]
MTVKDAQKLIFEAVAAANGAAVVTVPPPVLSAEHLAFTHAPFGMALLDSAMGIVHANATLAGWCQLPLADMLRGSLTPYVWAEDRVVFERAFTRTLHQGHSYHDMELRLTDATGQVGGKPRFVAMSMTRLPLPEDGHESGCPRVAVYVNDISRRKRAEQELVELANTDHLTGLANRLWFEESLQRTMKHARRYGRLGAVLYVDLNDFKSINDTHGHPVGDAVLVATARTLQGLFRETDTVARIGGDEFAVLMGEVSEAQAKFKGQVVERAIRKQVVELEGHTISCTASVGVQIFGGDHTGDIETILSAADKAMYERKEAVKALNG